ncbi:MAG: hypothetical protein LBK99_07525, partial [Opitutaceae bacterium]|nr:hypothetical protein [Opitutaceae bacterium]
MSTGHLPAIPGGTGILPVDGAQRRRFAYSLHAEATLTIVRNAAPPKTFLGILVALAFFPLVGCHRAPTPPPPPLPPP